jgi:hypothetical protein
MLATATCSFDVEEVRCVTVICFTINSLDEQNFEDLADELDSLITSRKPRRVVVDLQSLHDAVDEYGGTVIMCHLSAAVIAAMKEVGLQRNLQIRSSRNEAVWTF